MIELKLTFPTIDDAYEALGKLNGVTVAAAGIDDTPKPKKKTPAKRAAEATVNEFDDEEEAPAKKKRGSKKSKAPSVDDLKAHILECAGDGADQPAKVKEYVRSFGVAKISDMTEAQRQEAFDGAEEYFADSEDEEDPME